MDKIKVRRKDNVSIYSGEKIKVRLKESYVNDLTSNNQDNFNKLNDYIKRRQNNEYMTADEIAGYRKARTDYADSSKKLYGIARSRGTQVDEAREKQEKDWLEALGLDLDNDEKILSGYKNAEEYNAAVKDYTYRSKYHGKTYADLQNELTSLRFNRRGADVETDKALAEEIDWLKKYSTSDRGVIESMTLEELEGYKNELIAITDAKYDELYKTEVKAYAAPPSEIEDEAYGKWAAEKNKARDDAEKLREEILLSNENPVLYYDDNKLPVYLDERIGQLKASEDIDSLLADAEIKGEDIADNGYFDYYGEKEAAADPAVPELEFSQEKRNEMLAGLDSGEITVRNPDPASWGWEYKNTAPDIQSPLLTDEQSATDASFAYKSPLDDSVEPLLGSYEEELKIREQVETLGYNWDDVRGYLKYLRQKAEHNDTVEGWASYADDYPLLSTLGLIFGGPLQIIDLVGNIFAPSMYGINNPYDDGFVIANQAMMGKISENVKEDFGGGWFGNLASTAYSGIVSSASSAVTGVASVAIFGPVAGPVVNRVLVGSQAAAGEFHESLMNGASHSQAFASSVVAGAAEAMFESIPLDNLFNVAKGLDTTSVKKLLWSGLKQAGKQGLIEALEESGTNVVNEIADRVINGDSSQYERTIERLMASGKSYEEARETAGKEYWESLFADALGGFFGGLASGGVASARGVVTNYGEARFNSKLTKAIGSQTKADTATFDNILEVAKLMPNNTEVANALKAVDKKDSKSNVGTLTRAVYSALDTEFRIADTIEALDNLKSKYGENNSYINDFYASEYERLTGYEYTAPEVQQNLAHTTDTPVKESSQKSAKIPSVPASDSIVRSKDGVGYRAVTTNGKDTVVYGVDPETGNFTTSEGAMPSDQITFPDRATKAVFDNARNYSDTVADLYIGAYDPSSATVSEYDQAFGSFYKAGNVLNVQSFEDAWNNYSVYGVFDKATAEVVYKAGQNGARIANQVRSEFRKGKSRVYVDVDKKSLTSRQKVSIEAMEAIARTTGIRFYTFASYVKADGKRYYKNAQGVEKPAPNGYYDPKDSSIHIDLNAGNSGEGTMLFTVSHELVHYIKHWSKSKFNILADFLLEQYAEKDVSVEALVQAQIEKAKAVRNEDIDPDTAFEEVIADSMESMLTDGKVAEKITLLAEKDMSLVKKIKSYLKQLFEKIRNAYKGLNPGSREGRLVAEMGDAVEKLQNFFAEAIADASVNKAKAESADTNNLVEEYTEGSDVKYSEKDYPIDPTIKAKVDKALKNNGRDMHELSVITPEQNKDINRLTNITKNDLYRGKFTGGKHLFSENAIRHIIAEHGDFLREALRAQLPMTADDIARHLSAIKDNKHPSNTLPSKTREGYPSILTSYEINGYTLYAEEIKKPLGQNRPSDLVGHTIYKAPTLPTAASYTTSVQAQPKRQSLVLCNYYTTQGANLSTGNFVSDKSGNPALLIYYTDNGALKHDAKAGGIIALSSDGKNFTDRNGVLERGYVTCKKPFYISQDNRVFSNSETNVIERINDLKKQGYDCFIFDKSQGDNYMVAIVNKAQIVKQQPTILYSDRDSVPSDTLFDQLNIKKAELAEETKKQKAIEESEERASLIQEIMDTEATPESLEKYSEWSKRTGFDKIVERVKVLEKEVADLSNSYKEAAAKERKSEEEAKINESGLSEAEYYRGQAVEEFGYTPYFYDAGYLLPDGKLLNFSGEKDQHFGMRGEDHRAIGIIYADVSGGKALVKFMSDGNIRVMAETPGIDIITTTEPTSKQYSVIKDFVREYKSEGFFCVDFTDENGRTVGNYSYEGSPNPDRVVNDIKYFYENGEVREQSDISSFLYQDRGETSSRSILAEALESVAQTEAEKTRLAEYKEKADTLDQKQAELAEIRAQIKELAFAKGKKDTAKLAELRKKAAKLASSIDYYDKQLLSLESTKALRDILQREKAKAAKRQKAKDAAMLERYKEGRKKTELRTKIKKFKAKLETAMLNPTDNTYVPAGLISAMIDVCELIDTDTELYKKDGSLNKAQEARNVTRDRLLALEDEYSKLAENEEYVIGGEFDESVQAYLKDLRTNYSGKKLTEMSLEELSILYEVLNSINDILQDAKLLIGFGEAVDIYEAADSIVSEQGAIAAKHRKGGKRSLGQKGADWVVHKSLSPVRAAERMSGYNRNSFLVRLFNNFEKGVRVKNMFKMNAYKTFEELVTGENASEYESAVYDAYGQEYTDDVGRTFHVSKMQAMQAVLSYDREQANKKTLHIENGGLNFADIDMLSKGKLGDAIDDENIHRVKGEAAVAMVEEFREMLKNDTWAQKYMDAARTFFNSMAKDAINSTMLAVKHRIVAKDNFYIPYEVDKSFVVMEITGGYDMQQTINSYGMLQQMKDGAAQPLIVTGLNNIIDRHIEQVGTVYGLAVPVRDFNKVWNTRSGAKPVNVAIGENWGKEAKDLITQAVADIQSPRVVKDDPFLRKVKSNYISATFFANFSVITKQIGSMYSARSMIRHRSAPQMLANLAYTMFNYKKISAEVDKHTASVWMRRQGVSDAEVYDLLTEGKKHGIGKLASKIPVVKHLPNLIAAMDSAVALSLWKYCKQDVAKATGKTGDALLEATAEYFDEVVENTQSMADVLHRPEIQKQGGIIGESFGMFKTDLYQMAGQLQTVLGRHKAEGTKETKRALAKAAYGCLSSAIWASLMTTLFALGRYKVDPYRDDEDELTAESWLKYQSLGLIGDLAGYVFPLAGGEMIGVAKRFITGESDELVDSLALTAIQDGIDTVFTIADSLKEGEMPSPSEIDRFLGKSLQMFSVPYNNVSRSVKAIKYHIQDIANGEFLSFNAGSRGGASNAAKVDRYSGYIDNNDKPAAKDYITDWIDDRVLELIENDELEKVDVDKDEYLKAYYTNEAKKDVRGYFNSKYKEEYLSAVDKGDWKVTKRIKSILASTGLYENVDDTFISWRRSAVSDKYELDYKRAYKTNDTKAMEKIKNAIVATDFWSVADINKKLKSWRESADKLTEEAEG